MRVFVFVTAARGAARWPGPSPIYASPGKVSFCNELVWRMVVGVYALPRRKNAGFDGEDREM